MELGWSAALQALILAGCTWYMRQGSRADAASVKRTAATQATSSEILKRVVEIETDLALVKQVTLKQAAVDHRGPSKGKSP